MLINGYFLNLIAEIFSIVKKPVKKLQFLPPFQQKNGSVGA
jgi:hypothetical protein